MCAAHTAKSAEFDAKPFIFVNSSTPVKLESAFVSSPKNAIVVHLFFTIKPFSDII
jgi:hypothetical protein